MIKSSVSEDDVEEGEHSPSEVDDEGLLLTLDRFFPLANSEEDDILHLKSRCLLGIRLKTQISSGTDGVAFDGAVAVERGPLLLMSLQGSRMDLECFDCRSRTHFKHILS